MIVSSRGEATQDCSTFISPLAVSIWASMPMCPTGSPKAFSICRRRRPVATI
jgi:hypothetical protein